MAIPYVRDLEFEYGRVDALSPLVRRVIAENPGPFTFKGTGTYIVGRGTVAVIDPGPEIAAHLEAILATTAGETISDIAITHHHADHSPLARALKARTGATIWGCAAEPTAEDTEPVRMEAGHDLEFAPDRSLCDGGVIEGPGWTLEAIPTPGHTSNHLVFALAEENALFCGDHIMGWSTTVIAPPDGDLTDYLASLDRVQTRGFDILYPTHGAPITAVEPFIDAYRTHRLERLEQIIQGLASGPATLTDLVPRLYADVSPSLWPAASRSMLAGLIHLQRQGRAAQDGDAWRLA
ncbi:MBL fold metallo-hydrolase [Phenylobacterium immobile]|uniref:MBL fold metallo-hydrolase n=1 Tax=Phenylobacterium immobile TaxID=21 RepID=UPI000B1E447D|nr:MBL fold metallo-hydrolase [Phenylobacterium immobile]